MITSSALERGEDIDRRRSSSCRDLKLTLRNFRIDQKRETKMTSDSMKREIDKLYQEIRRELANHSKRGDLVAALLEGLCMRGLPRAVAIKESLERCYVLDMTIQEDVRHYAAAKLASL